LNLGNNLIKKIEGLEKLVNLKILHLFENLLEKIENLEHFIKLTELNLNKNKNITKIEGLDNLEMLVCLSLTSNEIEKIEGLDNLYKLSQLFLFNNPLKYNKYLDLSKIEELFIRDYNLDEDQVNAEQDRNLNLGFSKLLYNDYQNLKKRQIELEKQSKLKERKKALIEINKEYSNKTLNKIIDTTDIMFF
jgi:hypothetical protein